MRKQDLLSAADTNHDRRNIFYINECVKIFSASRIGKMNDVVGYLGDFASHFFTGSQVQLNTFTGAACKKIGDRRVRL